jgi:DNA-directed RNA polymerase omega subunit
MEKLPEKIDSKFRFVLLAAERAQQIIRGARSRLPEVEGKPTRVAIEEIDAGVIPWQYGPPPEEAVSEETGVGAAPVEEDATPVEQPEGS